MAVETQVNAWFDDHVEMEMRLYVAWKCGKLLEYWHGCHDLDELKSANWDGVVEAVDKAAALLFYLFRRPLFRQVTAPQ